MTNLENLLENSFYSFLCDKLRNKTWMNQEKLFRLQSKKKLQVSFQSC